MFVDDNGRRMEVDGRQLNVGCDGCQLRWPITMAADDCDGR
jgi:hypothetical protein